MTRKIVCSLVAVASLVVLLVSLWTALTARTAAAEPIDARAGMTVGDAVGADRVITTTSDPHKDRVNSNGTAMALVFWAFAAVTIGGALFVVTRKNLIAAVMGMVGSFLGISAVYMLLYASFLAVVQMLVYAGAIMVLFVFVIMILNRPEDDPIGNTGKAGKAIGAVAILYLLGRLAFLLMKVKPANPMTAIAAPGATAQGHDWGTTKALGTELFTGYLFPFEAISILLLVAVVGAIAIARPLHDDEERPTGSPQRGEAS